MIFDTALFGFAFLAALGGVGYQLCRHVQTNRPLIAKVLIVNAGVSAFLGIIIGGFIAARYPDWTLLGVGLCGFWSFPLVRWVEKHGGDVLKKRLGIADAPEHHPPPPELDEGGGYTGEGGYSDEGAPDAPLPAAFHPEPEEPREPPMVALPMASTQNLRSILRAMKAEGFLPGGKRESR